MSPVETSPRYVYYTATSLDGFLADEQDSLQWLFEQEHDPSGAHAYEPFFEGVGALVMGATTYCWVVDHLRETGEPWPYTEPTFVFTHRDLAPASDDVHLVAGAPSGHRAAIERAAGSRDVWVLGGGALAADLAAAGMLHRVLVSIASVTLGAGRPLLAGALDLRLTDVERNGALVCASYDVVGAR